MTERLIIDFPEIDREFSFSLGKVNYTRAHQSLEKHIHHGMFELVYVAKGQQVYELDGEGHLVRSDQLFLTLPDEEHSTGSFPEDKSLIYYLIFAPSCVKALGIGYGLESDALLNGLYNVSKRVIDGSSDIRNLFDELISCYLEKSPFILSRTRNCLSQLLITVLSLERSCSGTGHRQMQAAVEYIERNIAYDIGISDLVEVTGLSPSRFKTVFRREIGIPPREYILRAKVNKAREFLTATDQTITDIAHDLGFSSAQYFATVFKRFTCMSPAEYRVSQTLQSKG